jgi:hypothetical protein
LFWLSSSATLALAKPAAKTATITLVNMLAIDYLKESWLDLRNGNGCNGNRRVETMICNDVESKRFARSCAETRGQIRALGGIIINWRVKGK